MHIDLTSLSAEDRYKVLTAIVIPRPVAWITTLSPDGHVNAAPFSFFNLFGKYPALVILGLENKADGSPKDTTRNIAVSGEFVVNIATPDLNAQMVDSAAAYGPDESEVDALGLELDPSVMVKPPRLRAVPASIECRRVVSLVFGGDREILVGEAVGLATREGLVDRDTLRVEWGGDFPVARLFADRYARLEEIERRKIPTLTDT